MLTLILFTSLVILLLSWLWSIQQKYKIRERIGLKGPKTHFFLGNVVDIIEYNVKHGHENSVQMRLDYKEKYGDTFGFYIGPNFEITTTDRNLIREVFIKQFSNFTDRPNYHSGAGFPLGESLLQVGRHSYTGRNYGWKEIRSVISPVFTTSKLRLMHHIMEERCQKLLSVLDSKIGNRDSVELDIYDEFQAMTLDVIGRCAFGMEANSLTDRNDTFYVNARRFFNEINLESSWLTPFGFLFPKVAQKLRPFTAAGRAESVLVAGLAKVISERQKMYKTYDKIDLIQLLLQQDQIHRKANNRPPLHPDTIMSNCFAFLIAGYETTSTALAYAAYLLAKHPEVQERLREEIDRLAEEEGITYDSVLKAPYLDAVFKESLRLYPPVIFFCSRMAAKDCEINGLHIPAGTTVQAPVHALQWDESVWPNAKQFDPERFYGQPNAPDPVEWAAFGIGPRFCAGMRFAEAEFKHTVVRLLEKLRLELSDELKTTELKCRVSSVLMRPIAGVSLRIHRRETTH